jgi:hypothetical protein
MSKMKYPSVLQSTTTGLLVIHGELLFISQAYVLIWDAVIAFHR